MIPSHGLFCQTRTYPTNCPECQARVFFLECTCGSAVWFDSLGGGWPLHYCPARLAKPIRSDAEWNRLRLQATVAAIRPRPRQWVPNRPERHRGKPPLHFVATLQDLPQHTQRIAGLDSVGPLERAALKVRPGAQYDQVTLRDTGSEPHQVYTAIVERSALPGRLRRNMCLGVTLEARGLSLAEWFVLEIVTLPELGVSQEPEK